MLAEVLPSGKSDAVAANQQGGRNVAFVGDGIDDAPALALADVGLAIGTGTDVAAETADVILVSGDLRGVPNSVTLSRSTLANIHLNPVLAAAAMGFSSVFVLSNALRLRGFRPPVAPGPALRPLHLLPAAGAKLPAEEPHWSKPHPEEYRTGDGA